VVGDFMNVKKFSITITLMVLALALLQGLRMLITKLLFLIIPYNADGIALNSFITFTILIFLLFIYFICYREKINFFPAKKQRSYMVFTILVFLLILSSPSFFSNFSLTNIALLIHSTILIPLFEEILFRGIIWTKLEKIYRNKKVIFFTTTILFGLWHVGYIDSIIMNTSLRNMPINIPNALIWKVLIGIAFGIFAGFARYKTNNVYSGMLVHSFLNIFGK
jgi:membrane protease YdiL (CAAX protease family)